MAPDHHAPAWPWSRLASAGVDVAAAATLLAEAGVPVFPCHPGTKKPLIRNGFKGASTDAATVRSWWRQYPKAMIGVPTGEATGIVVVDVDIDAVKNVDGRGSLQDLEEQHGPLPPTLTQRTPRGGLHYLFRWPNAKIPNSTSRIGPGIDIRGDGGYMIVAPSVRADGGRYVWQDATDPADMPAWLSEQCVKRKRASRGAVTSDDALSRLNAECRAVAQAPAGTRNDRLNRAAFVLGRLVAAGRLERESVEARLMEAAAACGLVDDDGEDAVASTLRSGLEAEIAEPVDSESGRKQLTEDLLASAFADQFAGALRYCHHAGAWYRWVGSHWQKDETQHVFDLARQFCRSLNRKQIRWIASAKTTAAVLRFAAADRRLAATSDLWDADPFLLGTPGGTVDLRTGTIRPAAPEDFITRQTAVTPDWDCGCPLWMAFLKDATRDDPALIRFLQQMAGYNLTGDVREHALFFFYGPGGNGKSVLLNVLSGIMGGYATTAAMDSFTSSAFDKHPTDLAMLQGARLVCASETEEGRAWAESRIKQLTGGDPIRARFMRQDFFEFRPQFKLVVVGNHRPALRNVDEAAMRRFNMIPFTHKPETPDRRLEEKLKAEWPAILAWAIKGALDWQAGGLIRPAAVTDATREYFGEQDLVEQWIAERCETGNNSFCDTTANLFADWSHYAASNGEPVMTAKWLSQCLGRHGYRSISSTPGHRKKRGFTGIQVRPIDTSGQWQNRGEYGHAPEF